MTRSHVLLSVFLFGIGLLLPRGGYGSTFTCETCPSTPRLSTPEVVATYGFAADTSETDTTGASVEGSVQRKSPGRALGYSLGGTVILAPVFGVGLVIGPSFGHYYAENRFQANLGIGIRVLSGGAVVVGAAGNALAATGQIFGGGNDNVDADTFGLIGGIGAGILVVSAVVDIVMAPFAAQDFNKARVQDVSVRPTSSPELNQLGLAIQVRL